MTPAQLAAFQIANDYADERMDAWADRMAEHFARWDECADDREDARIERRLREDERIDGRREL